MADSEDTRVEAGASKKPGVSKARATRRKARTKRVREKGRPSGIAAYPRHSARKALRVPKAILEQNAGKACTDREAAKFAGLAYHGPSRVEISSSIKYGFLERPSAGNVAITDLAKKILRPQNPNDELDGLRQAVLPAARTGRPRDVRRVRERDRVGRYRFDRLDLFVIPFAIGQRRHNRQTRLQRDANGGIGGREQGQRRHRHERSMSHGHSPVRIKTTACMPRTRTRNR
jgi:hypothetical protein